MFYRQKVGSTRTQAGWRSELTSTLSRRLGAINFLCGGLEIPTQIKFPSNRSNIT